MRISIARLDRKRPWMEQYYCYHNLKLVPVQYCMHLIWKKYFVYFLFLQIHCKLQHNTVYNISLGLRTHLEIPMCLEGPYNPRAVKVRSLSTVNDTLMPCWHLFYEIIKLYSRVFIAIQVHRNSSLTCVSIVYFNFLFQNRFFNNTLFITPARF